MKNLVGALIAIACFAIIYVAFPHRNESEKNDILEVTLARSEGFFENELVEFHLRLQNRSSDSLEVVGISPCCSLVVHTHVPFDIERAGSVDVTVSGMTLPLSLAEGGLNRWKYEIYCRDASNTLHVVKKSMVFPLVSRPPGQFGESVLEQTNEP